MEATQTQFTHSKTFKRKFLILTLLFILSLGYATKAQTSPEEVAAPPEWLEPRGLNIVNLVGLVPESHLQGVRMVADVGRASVTYNSGVRSTSEIKVNVSINSNDPTSVYCLGAKPIHDHGFNVAPSSSMRVFKNNGAIKTEITGDILASYTYHPAEYAQPSSNSGGGERYQSQVGTTSRNADGSINVPANMGCIFKLDGTSAPYTDITAEFTMAATNNIQVTEVWTHVNTSVHSYIGPGASGNLGGLQTQMATYHNSLPEEQQRRAHDPLVSYLDREEKVGEALLSREAREAISTQADYMLIKYPPSYDEFASTIAYNSSGTMRAGYGSNEPADGRLSVDYVDGMLLPRSMHWVDSDVESDTQFLSQFDALYERDVVWWQIQDQIKSPEKFLPPGIHLPVAEGGLGIQYAPCMTSGTCSPALIQQIYNYTYTSTAHFYKIEATDSSSVENVCLRSVGRQYTPTAPKPAFLPRAQEAAPEEVVNTENLMFKAYLPALITAPPLPLDISPLPQCPQASGIFDSEGQMLDYNTNPAVFAPPFNWRD